MNDFERKRLERIGEKTSDKATPEDVLRIALRDVTQFDKLLVVVESEDGIRWYSAQTTLADAVYMLECAKLKIMFRSGDDSD